MHEVFVYWWKLKKFVDTRFLSFYPHVIPPTNRGSKEVKITSECKEIFLLLVKFVYFLGAPALSCIIHKNTSSKNTPVCACGRLKLLRQGSSLLHWGVQSMIPGSQLEGQRRWGGTKQRNVKSLLSCFPSFSVSLMSVIVTSCFIWVIVSCVSCCFTSHFVCFSPFCNPPPHHHRFYLRVIRSLCIYSLFFTSSDVCRSVVADCVLSQWVCFSYICF